MREYEGSNLMSGCIALLTLPISDYYDTPKKISFLYNL